MKTDKIRIIKLKEVNSTNEYCKAFNLPAGSAVVAGRQTGGKGTKGRSFVSDVGGVYLSLVRFTPDPKKLFPILINSCVAVCRTVASFGLKPVIRWSNDVLVNGRKISGTLIENVISPNGGCRCIVGIGLNVSNELPPELEEIATTIERETGRRVGAARVTKRLLANLKREYTLEDYVSYIDWFGQVVSLKTGEEDIRAVAVGVDENGLLICETDGERKKISSAEVSLRLQ